MAFNILDSPNNLSNQSNPTTSIPLSYSLNTTSKWIYSNYPEVIPSNGFGDVGYGNKFLNQATVSGGNHQIFYSYQDSNSLGPYHFSIQIFNPNSTAITFQRLYTSHRDSQNRTWRETNGGVWEDFFNSSPASAVSINPNGVYWLPEYSIPKGHIFTGNVRFNVSSSAIVTLYVYKSKSAINGTAIAYPKTGTGGQYSGTGDGYFFMANTITLRANELTNGKYFLVNHPDSFTSLSVNSTPKTSDLIPIKLVQNGTIVSPPTGNLGNWGAQYHYTLSLVNDTSSAKTFSAYIKTDITGSGDNWPVIASGSQCKHAQISPNTYNSWKWLSHTVAANSTYTDTFQYILGTNSYHKLRHIFRIN